MMYIRNFIGLFLLVMQVNAFAQPKATFEPFRGTVYNIPDDHLATGYGKQIPLFDV